MMRIYLVQHGKAAPAEDDPERGLTPKGRYETEKTAGFLASQCITVREIWQSGKKRSMQTAEILSDALAGRPPILEKNGLAPNDDPEETAGLLRKIDDPILIAGHLPFLDRLAGIILIGDPAGGIVAFRNSGVVCLERTEEDGRWRLSWAVVPDIL